MKKLTPLITGINLIAALVVINMIFSFYPFWRVDLTKNKIHSLSKVTQETIVKLDDVVTIKVFMTQDLPPEVKPIATALKTVLDEMGRMNRTKMRISYKDPNKDNEAKIEVEKFGIQPLQFSNIKADKFEVQNGYFGLAMLYGKKQIVLPVANDVGNLEYFVISGLKKLISDKTPTVAVAEENSNPTMPGNVQYLRKFLERNYMVVDATLDGETKLPAEADTLVIAGRQRKVDDKGLAKIREWVKSNKGLISFVSQIGVGQDMKAVLHDPTGLENIYSEYGMKMQPRLVWDKNAAIANFQTQSGAFLTQYPYWPQITSANINNTLPINSGVTSLMPPWASPIEIDANARAIFTSSKDSTVDDSFRDLTPTNNKAPGENMGKQVIGAINTDKVKIALVSAPQMIHDQFVANNQQNLLLALNMVDYFSQDSSLLTIRGKNLQISNLAPLSDSTKGMVKILDMIVPIVILLITALILGWNRKRDNNKWNDSNDKGN